MIVNKKLAMNQPQPGAARAETRVMSENDVENRSPGHKHLHRADTYSMARGADFFGQSKVVTF
ncbi:hypothetical protein D3C72_681270 [compost metagenome]